METTWQQAWRIFEIKPEGPTTLFHAWEGSRTLPLNKPLRAKQGLVSNPGKNHYKFRAGWHVALSKQEATEYLKRFTADRQLCVCEVAVRSIRKKPRANSPIYLAKDMMISHEHWKEAINETNSLSC